MNLFFRTFTLYCLFFCISAKGQTRFTASLHPSTINRDEYTTIRYLLENAGDVQNLTPPSFKNYILISGPLQESGMTNINGVTTNYLAISFVFKTKSPGKFRIPPAVARISGKDYKSNTVELIVNKTKSSTPGNTNFPPFAHNFPDPHSLNSFDDYIFKNGENVTDKVNKNMHLRLEVNKTSCFIGEPVVATYKLYTRLKSESKLIQNPSFNGFSVVDLQAADVTATSVEKLNGRDYNVYVIRKAQLYPLQDGKIELESAEIENKIQFIREIYAKNNAPGFSDIFNDFANASVPPEALIDQTVILKSKPVIITVSPLPEKDKPGTFKGAVGDFAIESGLVKNIFSLNESGKLIVMISGSGNLQLVTPPSVSWPGGIEAFDPKTSDILSMTSIPVSGKKIFEYPFSVGKPGKYILPPINFSYFDPVKKIFKEINTGSVSFTVTNDSSLPIAQAGIVTPRKNDNKNFLNRYGWLIFLVIIAMLSGLFIYLKKQNKHLVGSKVLMTDQNKLIIDAMVETTSQNQLNPLKETEKCLQNPDCINFYSLLMGEIKIFLSAKFSILPEEVNIKKISEKMDKQNISNETVLSLQVLLQDIEWQLYTPFERNEKMEALYKRSHEILQLINTYNIKFQ